MLEMEYAMLETEYSLLGIEYTFLELINNARYNTQCYK